jgi:KaiC/GvpD/RAD55 family RecA-like ATPase
MDEALLKRIDNNELVLLVTPSEQVESVNAEVMKHFVNSKDSYVIYTTFTKPYETVLKNFKKDGIKTDKIFFIDCATPITGSSEIVNNKKAIFCSPHSLTNISISLKSALKNMSEKQNKVLVLDTITTLMLYNKKQAVVRFIHNLSGNIRKYGVKSLIFTLSGEDDKKIVSELSRYVDVCENVK